MCSMILGHPAHILKPRVYHNLLYDGSHFVVRSDQEMYDGMTLHSTKKKLDPMKSICSIRKASIRQQPLAQKSMVSPYPQSISIQFHNKPGPAQVGAISKAQK